MCGRFTQQLPEEEICDLYSVRGTPQPPNRRARYNGAPEQQPLPAVPRQRVGVRPLRPRLAARRRSALADAPVASGSRSPPPPTPAATAVPPDRRSAPGAARAASMPPNRPRCSLPPSVRYPPSSRHRSKAFKTPLETFKGFPADPRDWFLGRARPAAPQRILGFCFCITNHESRDTTFASRITRFYETRPERKLTWSNGRTACIGFGVTNHETRFFPAAPSPAGRGPG